MKLLLILGASLTLSVAAQTDGESRKKTATPSTDTQPLPRAKDGAPGKRGPTIDPASRLRDSHERRRARIAEARNRARARAREKKPEAAKLVLPAESASDAELPGRWVLQSESLGKSLTEQFQKTVAKGATFKLEKLSGDYIAGIHPKDNRITVTWNEWKMESTTTRGDLKVTLTVTVKGTQHYEIVQLTNGTNPEGRKLLVKLVKDDTTSESFFQGTKMRTRVELPELQSGHWAIHEGLLYLQGSLQKEPWKFDRKANE